MGTWADDQRRLAVIGASSETGLGTTGFDESKGYHYQPTRNGWVSRVARNAAAEWGTETKVTAMAGALSTDFLPGGRWPSTVAAIDEFRKFAPTLVVYGGVLANEYVSNVDPATAEKNLRAVLDKIRKARPGVDILMITYPDIQWSESKRPWSTYTAITHKLAVEYGCGLSDLRQYIDGPAHDVAGLWTSDKAHMNDAGQSVVAAAEWTLLFNLANF